MFPLKTEEDVSKVACWERPPKKYGKDDVPWVRVVDTQARSHTDLAVCSSKRNRHTLENDRPISVRDNSNCRRLADTVEAITLSYVVLAYCSHRT